MFEVEIRKLIDYYLKKVKKLGSFFTFDNLMNSELHPAVIKYISAELDYLIYEDRKKLISNSVFDYSGKEIEKHFARINDVIRKSKKVSYEDIKRLLIQAISFNVNYVVRPRWSLSKLIFSDSDTKTIDEIRLLLNYVYYYDYIKNIIFNYLEKKKIRSVNGKEFEAILDKVDKTIFHVQTEKLVDNAIYSISDFFNAGEKDKSKIPVYTIRMFLEEKGINTYAHRLNRSVTIDEKQPFEIENIRDIIYSVSEGEIEIPDEEIVGLPDESKESELEPIKEEEPIEYEESIDEEEIVEGEFSADEEDEELSVESEENVPGIEEGVGLEELEDVDLLSDYEEEFKELEEETTFGSDQEKLEFDIDEKDQLDEAYDFKDEDEKIEEELKSSDDYEFEEEGEVIDEDESFNEPLKQTNNRPKDLFSYLNDKEMNRIVEVIFNEDREDFANTMEKMEECESYDEATEILKSVFLTYRVNPYSRDAVTLTNAVSNYFDQV